MYRKLSRMIKTVFSRCLEEFKKEESHTVEECGNCGSQLQKEISITGFAKNSNSKSCLRRTIKLFVFAICTFGFLYHTWTFLQLYQKYPTMEDASEEYPDSFSAPAITICNRNRLWRQRYCKKYPDSCTWEHTTWKEFCDAYPRRCPDYKPPDFNFGIPNLRNGPLFQKSSAFLNAVGPHEKSDLIWECIDKGPGFNKVCNTSYMIIQAAKIGLPYRCLTINSLLGKQYEESLNLTFTDNNLIVLNMHPEEFMNNNDLVQASVVLHDPRKLVNPMTEGVTLTAGKLYQLHPIMERKERLPPPYASKCMDYLKEWKKNGGYGPLSKMDCIDLCKIKAMTEEYRCVGFTMTYPNNYTVCNNIVLDASPEVNTMCSSSCRDACEENSYSFTSEISGDLQAECNSTDEHCKYKELGLQISYSRMMVQKFQQRPRFESIELFSHIGSYMGMWLGLSLASLFDVFRMIYDVIVYQLMRGKRNQKFTTPVEKFPHFTV